MVKTQIADLIVVGAGVIGLAHAYHAAKRGLKVLVIERGFKSDGASVRNFGMHALLAQENGEHFQRAQKTLKYWQEIQETVDIGLKQAGCLVVATMQEEMQVIESFVSTVRENNRSALMVSKERLSNYAPWLCGDNLIGGMWSEEAFKLDQRNAMSILADYLNKSCSVEFKFGVEVISVESQMVRSLDQVFHAKQIVVCTGDELNTLFANELSEALISRCQLQMMRTVPQPNVQKLDAFVIGGLSLARYGAFQNCEGMSDLKAALQEKYPSHLAHGIHAIVSQEDDGSLTIGDSHLYGKDFDDQRLPEVDELIMGYLSERMKLQIPEIAQRWQGSYAVHDEFDHICLEPCEGVRLVTITNGQGMTHGFAIAEEIINSVFSY